MRFKILTEIGEHYRNEEGTEGVRKVALGGLEGFLKLKYDESNKARDFARGTQIAENVPVIGSGRVKALAAYHVGQQNKHKVAEKANEEVIRVRQWLHRQGASLNAEGKIIWAKSTRKVEYDHTLESQNMTKIVVRSGLMYLPNGSLLDTTKMVTHFSGPGYAIYVMSINGFLHVSSHSVGYRHHSSLLAGDRVSGAGEVKVFNGKLLSISNKSGHYRPDVFHLLQTIHSLFLQKVPLDNCQIVNLTATGQKISRINEFITDNGFDDSTVESMQILYSYGHHLTPIFLFQNNLVWIKSTNGSLLGGIYDRTTMQRVSYEEFAGKMKKSGLFPRLVAASGAGR